jgi:dipeptidyl-peptidase 4
MRPLLAATILWTLSAPLMHASGELDRQISRIFESREFRARRFGPVRWIENGSAYTMLEAREAGGDGTDVVRYETATGRRSVLVSAAELTPKGGKPLEIEDLEWSADATRLLIFTNGEKVWRQNTRGDFWVLDRRKATLRKLGGKAPASSLMFAKFSPDARQVAYVRQQNIYVEEEDGTIRALTKDTAANIVNGTGDWVYEEELNLRDGFRWSPDGRQIAYWQFDTSGVQQFTLINNTAGAYPKITQIPYPKAGTVNSAVRVGVVSSRGGKTRWVEIPGDPRQNYIWRMEWAGNPRELAIGQLNRLQNRAVVYLATAETGKAKVLLEDRDDAWVDVPEAGLEIAPQRFDWLDGGQSLLWLSEKDGWRHAYAYPRGGGAPRTIATGAGDIIGVEGTDPEVRWLYFLASPENATERYLYRTRLDQAGAPERLTPAAQTGTHSYDISPDCHWALHVYSQFDEPPVTELIELPAHKVVRPIQENGPYRAAVASLGAAPVEFLRVPVAGGLTADGWLLKPKDFDPAKKYPLLVYVYGEPASSTVMNSWGGARGLFHRALANEGYLVASFDNRGSPSPRGREWRKSIYGAVGVLATEDQTAAVLALAQQRPYVDLDRVAVWGWSGGGTNTLNLMFRSPDVFRVGISVAPVPDQKLYDTIYQERYMGLPDGNAEGYKKGSAIYFAEGLKGNLLVIHGTGDDNVHFQGTQMLINRLVEAGKAFDFMEYPNRTHSISEGAGTTLHLYRLIARYLEQNAPPGGR